MSISFNSSITLPKVSTGLAGNVQSERSQNTHLVINPSRGGQDAYGRRVSRNTIVTLTAGDNPNERINIENDLRANYSSTLNAGGIAGESYQNLDSFGRYDTLVNSSLGRGRAFGLNGEFKTKAPPASAGYSVAAESDLNNVAKFMQRKNQAQNFSSASYYGSSQFVSK